MRTIYLLNIIIVCLAFIMSLFTIKTQNNFHSGYSEDGYTYNYIETNDATSETKDLGQPTESRPKMIHSLTDEKVPAGEDKTATAMTESFYYEMGDVRLIGEPGSLKENVLLSINGLDTNILPPLNAGMVNVTADYAAYRMLPHGMIFNNDIEVVLPYDTTLLPMGFTPNDIKSYYYDERHGSWIEIERDSVDMVNHLIISRVNHFTDFINAVIKTPEMPETSAYVPTVMSDIKAANPLEGINLMQPPTANNNGTANLSYPLEIPAGRNGMQPNLALTYNSGGGNGWLGVGWDISIPAITVETRWGVPRYNSSLESEVYVLGGEQLVTKGENNNFNPMPHRTNVWQNRMPDGTQFYPRVNEVFDSIVRHGIGPTNYWWSVTDRNGITNYYGKQKGVNALDTNSVLRDESGNIAHWALTESVDPYGNNVKYYYDIVHDSGVPGSSNDGIQIYLSSISYTGIDTIDGKYEVVFDRQGLKKTDISISGRYGFKEVTADLLCNMQVYYNNEIIKAYLFRTENNSNSLYKTRLTDLIHLTGRLHEEGQAPLGIFQKLCPGTLDDLDTYEDTICGSFRYHFDYYDRPIANSLFSDVVDNELNTNYLASGFVSSGFDDDIGKVTALGGTKGKSWSLGGTVSVGVGANVCMTSISVGGNFDYSASGSEGFMTLIDLDGDGLADKIFKLGDEVYFSKQTTNGQEINFQDVLLIEGISDFLKESSDNISWGLQASAGLSLSGGWPTTNSLTSTYFSDVNADGLPDLITDDGVLFNDLVNGIPTFKSFYTLIEPNVGSDFPEFVTIGSTTPCGGIIFDNEVSDSIACEVGLVYDTVLNDVLGKRYGEGNQRDIMIWKYVDSLINTGGYVCDSINVANDTTERYYDLYVYKKVRRCEPPALDPDMDAVKVWVAPMSGTIKIDSYIQLIEDTSRSRQQSRYANGIRYSAQWNHNNLSYFTNYFVSGSFQELFNGIIYQNDYDNYYDTSTIYVNANDVIFFRLQSNGNRSFDKVNWEQTITYINMTNPGYDDYGRPKNHYNSKEDFVLTGEEYFQAYKDGEVHITGTLSAETLSNSGTLVMLINNIPSFYRIVSNMQPINIDMTFDVSQNDSIRFWIIADDNNNYNTTWSNIHFSPRIEYSAQFPTYSTNTILDTLIYYPPVRMFINNYTGYWPDSLYHYLFGPLYRGWGQFAYNNNIDTNSTITDPIYSQCLKIDPVLINSSNVDTSGIYGEPSPGDTSQNALTNEFDANNMYYPLSNNTRWVAMYPNSQYQAWYGYGNINYITREMMTNTRLPNFVSSEIIDDIEIFDGPVPVSTQEGQSVKTIRKFNRSELKNFSMGLSIAIINVGGSSSKGSNKILTDYMDLNGDRYPDFVGSTKVQYSQPWGGIGPETDLPVKVWEIGESSTRSTGETFGASYSMPKRGTSNNQKNAKISFDGQGSAGASLGDGCDKTKYSWMDINGDGLPDKVINGTKVSLNIGYDFLDWESWNQGTIREGISSNKGLSIGLGNFNIGQASIGGGVGVNISNNETKAMLLDFNGDGLPDKVRKLNDNSISVTYNLGNGTWSPSETFSLGKISYGSSFSESGNIGLTLGFTFFSILKFNIGLQTSPYNKTFSRDSVQLVDINGDGYVDYVTSNSEESMRVRYNQTGKTNLLKRVTNFTGSKIEMDYVMPLSSFEQPQRSWVLDTVRTEDPYTPAGGAVTLTAFEYKNPHYDRFERIAYGYDTVVIKQLDTENGNTLYRQTVKGYHNHNFNKRGKLKSETTFDNDWNPYIEKLYDIVLADMDNGHIIGDSACPANAYPLFEAEIVNYYEGDNVPHLTTVKRFQYDKKRNVICYINYGDTTVDEDNLYAYISYKKGMGYNLISLADTIRVQDKDGNLLRKRTASYNSKGKMTRILQYNGSSVSDIDIQYNSTYGNISRITFPPNNSNQRLYYDYTYDPVVHSYPVQVTNALGYYSTATYDYRWGKPLITTDINGNEMHYSYDFMGRTKTITAPYELDLGQPYTIKMEYHPVKFCKIDIFSFNTPDTFSFARTYHYNSQNNTNDLRTTLLCDGFGRVLQTKKDAEINGQEVSIVSGKIIYDAFGRTVTQYHPFTEPLTQDSIFNHYFDSGTETVTTYDILDRQKKVTLPTGDTTVFEYGFNGTQFLTRTIDANGNTTTVMKDGRGLQRQIIDADSNITSFEYNAMGELIISTDPDGHSTNYGYDMLGQKISRVHPDAGLDRFQYDRAGNMISHQNKNLQNNNNQWIEYEYNYNQLTHINYPENRENNVIYEYGAMGDPYNRAGKIVRQEDASGYQEFSYGALGEITQNIRTFVLPNENGTYTFAMNFEYDSWNRILTMEYPDGEKVDYKYNIGGLLSSMTGFKGNATYPYIDSIQYNKFEAKTGIYYGNGTYATYDYDILQRLEHLTSYTFGGDTMQDIYYTFDNVNNITHIENVAGTLTNGLGGNYESNYTYDNLYRLTNDTGYWNNGTNLTFNLSMEYAQDGRIVSKRQNAMQLLNGIQTSISYNNTYNYNSGQPHTLNNVIDSGSVNQNFAWDANGNLVFHANNNQFGTRRLCWDEENRIMGVADGKFISYYVYDAGGERTYKLTGAFQDMIINGQQYNYNLMNNPTLYTSPYLVATPKGYTKHYYAGSERIISKIGCGGLSKIDVPFIDLNLIKEKILANYTVLERTVNDCLSRAPKIIWDNLKKKLYGLKEAQCEKENDLYYYHPDHLGSGTWITYTDGSAIQHLHYLPFGEEQIDQRLTNFNSRYTFSAKEKDIETGYSYFGARYYTSDLSIWLSVDPLADKYPSLSPYNYCANNPIRLVDPNGEDYVTVVDDEKKTITIQATYYTNNEKEVKEAAKKWNGESGLYKCNIGEGENAEKYTVNFDLKVEKGGQEAFDKAEKDGKVGINMVDFCDLGIGGSYGETKEGNDVKINTSITSPAGRIRTISHELGHTIGIGEWTSGLMERGGMGSGICRRNIQQLSWRAGLGSLPKYSSFYNNPDDSKTSWSQIGNSYNVGRIK